MPKMAFDLDGIWQRHHAVVSSYPYLTGAERDRRALLAEVDRLQGEVGRLQAELTAWEAEAARTSCRKSATG